MHKNSVTKNVTKSTKVKTFSLCSGSEERQALERSADGGPTHPPIQNPGYGPGYIKNIIYYVNFGSRLLSGCLLSIFIQ